MKKRQYGAGKKGTAVGQGRSDWNSFSFISGLKRDLSVPIHGSGALMLEKHQVFTQFGTDAIDEEEARE